MIPGPRKVYAAAGLVLCTGFPIHSVADEAQCSTTCKLIKAEISSLEGCAKSRKSLPRPKIGRFCQEAFDEAFQLTCVEACQLHGTGRALPSRLSEACDKRKREVPRPVAHKACVDGFNAGFAATTALVTKRVESMEEFSRQVLVEKNAWLLKEADAERETLEEAESVQAAKQARQKEEEDMRARKAVEDKSAEVKRKKEALSMKQDRDTAKALEEIELDRKNGEQGKKERARLHSIASLPKTVQEMHDGTLKAEARGTATEQREEKKWKSISGRLPWETPQVLDWTGHAQQRFDMEPLKDSPYFEVLMGENLWGFETSDAADRPNDFPTRWESAEVSKPAEKERTSGDLGKEDSVSIELPSDGSFWEVLTTDHVEGFETPVGQGKVASQDHGLQERQQLTEHS